MKPAETGGVSDKASFFSAGEKNLGQPEALAEMRTFSTKIQTAGLFERRAERRPYSGRYN